MDDAVKDASSAGAQPAAVAKSDGQGVVEAAKGILWYPVGILLGLLAVANVFLLCLPAR